MNQTKRCSKCGEDKDLDEFHRNRTKKDGRQTFCKVCSIAHHKEYVSDPTVKETVRQYYWEWTRTPRGREAQRKNKERYTERYPEKIHARNILHGAILACKITRPAACSECNKPCEPNGHHSDYTKPLEVIWLCRECHTELHNNDPRP